MTTVEVQLPPGMTKARLTQLIDEVAANTTARERVAAILQQQEVQVGPATAAQLAAVEERWRHVIDTYGAYSAADIARLRGTNPQHRSGATQLAKAHGLLALRRGRSKLYPTFQFSGTEVHSAWQSAMAPLVEADWAGDDILLWLVSPHVALDGREPAELLVSGQAADAARLKALTASEAAGIW